MRVCRDYLEGNGSIFRDDLVFRDEAQSGAGAAREGFDNMMSAVLAKPEADRRHPRGRPEPRLARSGK